MGRYPEKGWGIEPEYTVIIFHHKKIIVKIIKI